MAWTATETVGEWGDIRLTVAGVDVTTFRGVDTVIAGWQHTDPYGPNTAAFTLPGVRLFDDRGTDPDLAWLSEGAKVRIDHLVDGVAVETGDPLFYGIIDSIEETGDGTNVSCSGWFTGRLAMRMHQPTIVRRDAKDAGVLIAREVKDTDVRLTTITTGIELQQRGSRDMTRLGYIDAVLGLAITPNGDSVTILPSSAGTPGAYEMAWRDLKTTADATVYLGAPGVQVSLTSDLVDRVTAIYGEGVSPRGERWRGAKYPNLDPTPDVPPYPYTDTTTTFGLGTTDGDTDTGDGITVMTRELAADGVLAYRDQGDTFDADVEDAVQETQRSLSLSPTGTMSYSLWRKLFKRTDDTYSFTQAFFKPLAQNPVTRKFDYAPDGTVIGLNDTGDTPYDPTYPVVETFQSFGEGVTKKRARANASAQLARSGGRSGTVTLDTDPAEMSRFDLRAGMTLGLAYLNDGASTTNVYISSVQVDWSSRTVTLAVATTARHYLDLATLRQRRMEARQDPAKQWRHQLRRSAQTSDAIMGWEGESGAGIIRSRNLTGGKWNVFPMVACEYGTMGQLKTRATPGTAYIMAVFADKVNPGSLQRRLGNPFNWEGTGDNQRTVFEEHAQWLVDDERLLVEAWGTPDQPCGFWPHRKTNASGNLTTWADDPSGKHRDDGTWDFATDTNILWVAVWPQADCEFHGRARISINDAP